MPATELTPKQSRFVDEFTQFGHLIVSSVLQGALPTPWTEGVGDSDIEKIFGSWGLLIAAVARKRP